MPILSSMKSISIPKLSFGVGDRMALTKASDWLTSPTGVSKIVNLCSVILSGYLCVLAGEELLKAELFKPPVVEITSGSGSDSGTKQAKGPESYQIITTRNLFGSTAPAPVATPAASNAAKPKLRLVGTNSIEGDNAFAIIEDQNKNEQDVFNLSDQVFTYGKLVEIGNESVKLEYPDRVDTLEIEEGKPAAGSALGEEPPSNSDQTDFAVSEGELNEALANLPLLLSQARAVPYFRNGQSIGMRLFAIRSGSLYEKLGLQNGDIITSVNDNSLSDPTQALRIFEQLKNERNIGVKMERNGLQRDSRYSIR